MDPRYIDFGEVGSSVLHPYNKKNCGIRVDPDLFRSVNVLGYDNRLVGGRGEV